MDQERGISAKSVEILDENGFPSSPPPAYSYLEPESESPMPAGIPFQEAPPESRIASATSILPTASRLVSAKSGLCWIYIHCWWFDKKRSWSRAQIKKVIKIAYNYAVKNEKSETAECNSSIENQFVVLSSV